MILTGGSSSPPQAIGSAARTPPLLGGWTAKGRVDIGMQSLLAAAMMLASISLGASQSAAQTSPVMPSGTGSTSPLGTGLGEFAADLQSATLPYSGTVNPAPCSIENHGRTAMPAFDGGGIRLSPPPRIVYASQRRTCRHRLTEL
jgi:hypothetical protein